MLATTKSFAHNPQFMHNLNKPVENIIAEKNTSASNKVKRALLYCFSAGRQQKYNISSPKIKYSLS
jgi:hypothetical protein